MRFSPKRCKEDLITLFKEFREMVNDNVVVEHLTSQKFCFMAMEPQVTSN